MQRSAVRSLQASTSNLASRVPSRDRRLSFNESLQPGFDLNATLRDLGTSDPLQASTAQHLLLEKERQRRHYARLVAFQLPLLAEKYQNKFAPPPSTHAIKLRLQDYQGEAHPASRKVVLSIRTSQLGLTPTQLHKFRLLAASRWDVQTDVFRLSVDSEPSREENARLCSEMLERVLAEAKDGKDTMQDIPLDTRHTQAKISKRGKSRSVSLKDYPKEWLPSKPIPEEKRQERREQVMGSQ